MSKRILVLGAGQSTAHLISFLLESANENDWFVTVGDRYEEHAAEKVGAHDRGAAVFFDVNDAELRSSRIQEADLVINMLPPTYQHLVAWDCVRHGTHMVTASYEDLRMKDLDLDANRRGIILLNEMGLDPGIDHMSAMSVIDDVRSRDGHVVSFKSYGAGLPEPEFRGNPLRYAITWNPRNIVMSGEHGATYLVDNMVKMVPHHEVFQRTWTVDIEGLGEMEAYPNRDSLYYRGLFGLDRAHTMIRGTLRYPGWCETWLQIVRLGIPNENMRLPDVAGLTYRDVTEMFIPLHLGGGSLERRAADFLKINPTGKIMDNLKWLGLFSDEPVPVNAATVSEAMIHLINRKLALGAEVRDIVIVMHQIEAEFPGEGDRREQTTSTLVEYGQKGGPTAMSRGVGLPVAISAKLILTGELQLTGCQLPTNAAIYPRVLRELESLGLEFKVTGRHF